MAAGLMLPEKGMLFSITDDKAEAPYYQKFLRSQFKLYTEGLELLRNAGMSVSMIARSWMKASQRNRCP